MVEPVQYPRWRYHATKPDTLVHSEKEERALGAGWFDNPAQARPPKGEPTPAEQIAAANAPPNPAKAAADAARAKAEADARAKAEADARARAEADAKARSFGK